MSNLNTRNEKIKKIVREAFYEAQKEYPTWLYHEGSLQCAIYHHLRELIKKRLSSSIRVWSEYDYTKMSVVKHRSEWRADLAIVSLNQSNVDKMDLRDSVEEVCAIIEISYKRPASLALKKIDQDFRKIKRFIGQVKGREYESTSYFIFCVAEVKPGAPPLFGKIQKKCNRIPNLTFKGYSKPDETLKP